eukprot:CAMPEP_0118892334 /NCGR_PEP_ID=MMETSP1166-20130328/1976_1 /TAXON_ID=1104430 /ORGANISM="Chrysoreinhardia sp, Strain CCMP3193" /LENGTH=260 /DNA_ID=CAMNT_0006831049 /DNA_START=82 /DNA_END=864 /DNA_ORIENTATION=+
MASSPSLPPPRRLLEEEEEEEEEEEGGWLCVDCNVMNGPGVSCPQCDRMAPEEEVALEAALKASADEYAAARDDERSLEEVLELSRVADEERRREVEASKRNDDDAVALAVELSKQTPSVEDDLRIAMERSRLDEARLHDEERRLLQEALRRSTLDTRRGRSHDDDDGGVPAVEDDADLQLTLKLSEQEESLEKVLYDDDDDERRSHTLVASDDDLELTLKLSEQVESLEKVLEDDADEEQLRFALETSHHDPDEFKRPY